MSDRLPDFVIIGAMKCGTSSLHEQLALRSGLWMSTPKEPNFFSDGELVRRGLADYSALFGGAHADQLCGESSTHYTKLPTYAGTAERMREFLPRAKFIYIMRDPIDRMVSQYIHEWTQREFEGDIEDAVLTCERYVAYSSYARQLKPFLAGWGPDHVLPICFERMVRSPNEELARVCAFIGDRTPDAPNWDRSKERQNTSSERVRRSAVREKLLEIGAVRVLKEYVPQQIRSRIRSHWQMRKRPELSAAVRDALESRLAPDLAELGRWLGIELTARNWRQAADAPLAWKAYP